LRNLSGTDGEASWTLLIGTFVWLFAAVLLHIEARRVLGDLRDHG
jgi:hypothetical protein